MDASGFRLICIVALAGLLTGTDPVGAQAGVDFAPRRLLVSYNAAAGSGEASTPVVDPQLARRVATIGD